MKQDVKGMSSAPRGRILIGKDAVLSTSLPKSVTFEEEGLCERCAYAETCWGVKNCLEMLFSFHYPARMVVRASKFAAEQLIVRPTADECCQQLCHQSCKLSCSKRKKIGRLDS
jgi:hypothetical protein